MAIKLPPPETKQDVRFYGEPETHADFIIPGLESLGDDRFRLNGIKLIDFSGMANMERLVATLGGEEADAAAEHFYRWLEMRQLGKVFAERCRRIG